MAKVYLVSVGVSTYQDPSRNLLLPENDAKTITWIYRKNTEVEYRQLLNEKATAQSVIDAMHSVYAKAGADDIVVFFFSGHGYQGGFLAYDKPISYRQIRRAMASSKCPNKMIFADACYSGMIRTSATSGSSHDSSSEDEEAQKANVMLFLSSRSNETSSERRDMKNGFFTSYLQKGLRGGADSNKDRVITARELYDYVSTGVIKISGKTQHPVMWGRFADDMPVMKWKKTKNKTKQ